MRSLLLAAVAYDPKVVAIWEGMRRYFREEAHTDVEPVLFLNYEAQVRALIAGRVDIAWNTNLAYLQAERWSEGRCQPLACRDTDLGWTTRILAVNGGPVTGLSDLRGKTLALGSRDSGHAAVLPVHFLEQEGLVEGRDYRTLRFNVDVGLHGDTGTSELDVLKAVLNGDAEAGAVGSPFWEAAQQKGLFPKGAIREIWSSPAYNHCIFTAAPGLETDQRDAFVTALLGMRWENPAHRAVLEAEGLKAWVVTRGEGYDSLRVSAEKQGLLRPR